MTVIRGTGLGSGENATDENPFGLTREEIAAADKVFRREATFVAGCVSIDIMPDSDLPEIAFAGRSNVGKSSLINALTNRRALARASNTPGRTQQINLFNIGNAFQLADMPGYGYAVATRSKVHAWNDMVRSYLETRRNLKRLCVLVDARHGLLEADEKAFKIFDSAGIATLVVLTKTDKVKRSELETVKASVEAGIKTVAGAFPYVHLTSSEKGYGIPELRALLLRL